VCRSPCHHSTATATHAMPRSGSVFFTDGLNKGHYSQKASTQKAAGINPPGHTGRNRLGSRCKGLTPASPLSHSGTSCQDTLREWTGSARQGHVLRLPAMPGPRRERPGAASPIDWLLRLLELCVCAAPLCHHSELRSEGGIY
jgi:hypothetical protein